MTKALHTPLCDLLGIDVPIANAGMAMGSAGAPLAAAVAASAGLGGLGGIYREGPARLRDEIRALRAATSRPFSVNLWCWLLDVAPVFLDVCIEERVPSVTLSFGPVGPHADRAREAGLLVIRQVQTVDAAREASRDGVDVIIAQGGEAGGHTGSVATMALVPQVVDVAGDIPVLAAGGIADGRGLVAALALGAQGVVMGTRFVAAEEAGTSDRHRQGILQASADDTIWTDVFDIVEGAQWPQGISGRTIRSSFTDQWHGREDELRAARKNIRAESNPLEEQGLFAGQSSGLVHDVKPAAQIMADIVEEATEVLTRLSNSLVPK